MCFRTDPSPKWSLTPTTFQLQVCNYNYNYNYCSGVLITITNCNYHNTAIDQAHEQNNALVKGLVEQWGSLSIHPSFRKWMLAGPERRLLTEFEAQYSLEVRKNYSHHKEGLSAQRTFKQQVLALVETIEDMQSFP